MDKKLGKHSVVLLGVGHTNAHVLRMWKMKPISNAELVCVSNFPFATYSGMMPGVLSGQYDVGAMEFDLVRYCASAGARLIVDEVVGIDHERNHLIFANRPSLPFSLMSIGIGSRPSFSNVELNSKTPLVAVKPMQTFLARLESRIKALSEKQNLRIAVVGGGIGSIEIAFCLNRRIKKQPESIGLANHQTAELTLLTGASRIGTGLLESTCNRVETLLERDGIRARASARVVGIDDAGLQLKDGTRCDADVVIWATSAVGPELLSKLDLPLDQRGFLRTRSTLQCVDHDQIFAVGDTGTIENEDLVKAGVFAVRQGPILWDNIRRSLAGRALTNYVPQKGFLKLINTADEKSIAEYGGRSFYGGWCWKLKDRIDQKFMKMYRDYSMAMMSAADPSGEEPEMRCLGCGGKIGSQLLSEILEELEVPKHDSVIIGLDEPDDAAIVRTANNQVTVTTDFFASPLDDPYVVGRIAMLNSASDCCVMGAQPTAALAIVQLPLGHQKAQAQVMRELMAGSVEELKKMNATIVGGHSIEGPRLTIGYTILGDQIVDPKTKGQLAEGDHLVLTKPLGTGAMLAALMQGNLPGRSYIPMLETMLQSNYIALRLIREFGINGLTDVTGFGLAGHLAEMLRASRLSAKLRMEDVPLLPGCQELIDAGFESTLAPDNRLVTEKVRFGADNLDLKYASLFDPQTSGGLLFGVSENESGRVIQFLRDEGFERTCVIGTVEKPSGREAIEFV